MTAQHIDGDLSFRQEGPDVRATAGGLNLLFPRSERDKVAGAYDEWSPRVRDHFQPRWRAHSGANISEAELEAIVREITLQWMCFYTMHRAPIQMSEAEWNQPLTRRIIRTAVERAFPRGSEDATGLCAQLMGITRDAFLKWAKADETFLGMM